MNRQPPYFPNCWSDDDQMSGLMSKIKIRSVNSVDFDRKMRFWSDLIGNSCEGERNAVFNVEILKRRFQRGDTIPASLPTVIEHMVSNGELMSVSDWKEKHTSWLGWGVSRLVKTSGWLFGSVPNKLTEKYLHLSTVKKQASQLLELYAKEFKDEVDCTGEVVAYEEFYDKSVNIIQTQENFDIAIEYLTQQGDVTVGTSRTGEKILKFRDRSDDGPVRFTEADASVHDIRRAINKLDKEIEQIEQKIKKIELDMRAAIRTGEKTKSLQLLRQKKRLEKDLSDKDKQYQNLLTMMHQLGSTKHNRDVIDAFKAGTQAFKNNLAQHGLSPDKIDETMDEVQNAVEDYREIEEAMGQGIGAARSPEQDLELEAELAALVAERKEKEIAQPASPAINLPEVPPGSLGISLRDSMVSAPKSPTQMSLEERLNRLREEAL